MIGDNFCLLLFPYLPPATKRETNLSYHTCPFCGHPMRVFVPYQSWDCQTCFPMTHDMSGGGKVNIFAHALLFWAKGLGCDPQELEGVLRQQL